MNARLRRELEETRMQRLSMFLACKRGLPFCLDCLRAHGAFGSNNEEISSQVRSLIASKYSSVSALIATCSNCNRPRVAVAFHGRPITDAERTWTIHLLGAEKVIHLLLECAA